MEPKAPNGGIFTRRLHFKAVSQISDRLVDFLLWLQRLSGEAGILSQTGELALALSLSLSLSLALSLSLSLALSLSLSLSHTQKTWECGELAG